MTVIGPANPEPSTVHSFSRALRWSYVLDGGRQIITTAITFVLARMLGPSTFGLIALALVFVLFVDMLQRQGLTAALVQRQRLSERHLDAAFWAILGVSVGLTAISIALAGAWSRVNNLPELQNVVIVLSLVIPIKGLIIVQDAVFRRAMDFRALAIRTNVAVVGGGITALALAAAGAGVWALVGQQLTSAVLGLILIWKLSDWRPRMRFSWDALKDLLGFSSLSFLATAAVFVGNRSDALLIGIFFGPVAAGLYYFVTRLVTMVTDLASRALQSAALPELSRFQNEPELFRHRTMTILGMSAMIALPLLAILASTSDDVLKLIGEQEWGLASGALQVLALSGAFRALTMFVGPMLQAIGRPGRLARLSGFAAVISAATFIATGAWLQDASTGDQVIGLASARAAVGFIIFLVYMRQVLLLTGTTASACMRVVAPAFAAATFAWGAALAMQNIAAGLGLLPRLMLEVGAAGLAALVTLAALEPRLQRFLAELTTTARSRRQRPSLTRPRR